MPSENVTLERVYDEMRSTFEQFKSANDQALAEVRKTGDAASAMTQEKLDKLNAAMAELRKEHDDLSKRIARPGVEMGAVGADSPEAELHKRAFLKYLRGGLAEGRSTMTPEEIRSLDGASDQDGGFLVPPAFESGLVMAAYDQAEVRPVCQPLPTGSDVVILPALSKPTVGWGRRGVDVSAQTLNTGGERIEIFDQTALTLIHNSTLEDEQSDVWAELNMAFSMALAESEDDAFVVGAGDDSPQGILGDADVLTNYTATGVAAALTDASNNGVDALIAMLHALKKTYRRNSTWGMNSTTEGAVRTLKDSNGQYLWQPPVQAGNPALLLGRPIINPEGMADVAAGTYPILLGDFGRGYAIRDRRGIVVQRLTERYAEKRSTGFLVTRRVGGKTRLAEAFRVLKVAAS